MKIKKKKKKRVEQIKASTFIYLLSASFLPSC